MGQTVLHNRKGFGAPTLLVATALLLLAVAFGRQVPALGEQYLSLHSLMEAFSVIVSALIFAVGWNAFSEERSGSLVLFSCAFLGIGLLDLVHLLSYPGMPVFVTESSGQKSIWFWLCARSAAAATLLWAAWAPWGPLRRPALRYPVLVCTLLIASVLIWIGFFHLDRLPTFHVEGSGLTSVKIAVEFVLVLCYGAAGLRFLVRARDPRVAWMNDLALCCFLAALSEICFTLYVAHTDVLNALGHVYKVLAFWFLYKTIFLHSVRNPIEQLRASQAEKDVLLRQLQQSSDNLAQLNAGLEQRVAERTEQLQAASQAKSQFLASMSHELRTPLNAILGFAQLLEAELKDVPGQADSVDKIQRAGWHLLELINEVLDLSRIESGALQLSLARIDPRELMAETLLLVKPLADSHGIEVRAVEACDCIGSLVSADPTRLRQALLNLLSNAVKYNRPGGSVSVSCSSAGADRVRITVEDTGSGLSAQQQAHLFEPFNRLGREVENIEGTGIGLIITRRLVEAMGGSIGVASIQGEGSRFWVELQVAPGEAASVAHANVFSLGELPRSDAPCTLLYVEDNPVNLLLIQKVVATQPGWVMLSANSGARGLEVAREQRPDVIILDIGLPDMSGLEVVARLKADAETRDIPVLALSGHADSENVEQALGAGFSHYLTKPIRIKEFLSVVARCVRRTVEVPAA